MLNGSTTTFHVMILNWGKSFLVVVEVDIFFLFLFGYLSEPMRMGFSIPKNITIPHAHVRLQNLLVKTTVKILSLPHSQN